MMPDADKAAVLWEIGQNLGAPKTLQAIGYARVSTAGQADLDPAKARTLTGEQSMRLSAVIQAGGPCAIGYARVSTSGQAEDGVSLAAQDERIKAWCLAHGYGLREPVEVDAGFSGGRADNRPALKRALEAVCREKGVLVVYSLSRLARSTRDALDIVDKLHKAGANLVSLSESIDTTTAIGTFFFTVLAGLAALERDLIAERTSMAMAHKRSLGEYTGGQPPYGFRAEGGKLVRDEDEQRIVAMMRRGKQTMTAAGIARFLNGAGVQCRGSVWHAKSVRRVLGRTA